MKISLEKSKNKTTLQVELINLLREQFNLKMQLKSGQFKQLHLLKRVRRDIAVIKTYLSQVRINTSK